MENKQTVVITGAASGIGRALALEAQRLGLAVYATDRDPEALTTLADVGCHTAVLDVCAGASQQGATPADKMARQVWRKLLRRCPPPVIYAGRDSWLLPRLRRWLPQRWLERVLRRVFHLHLLN